MGTRHLICVVKNGEYKIAQYGQWDGYPSGQGVDILNFLSESPESLVALEQGLDNLYAPTQQQMAEMYSKVGYDIKADGDWISFDKAKDFSNMFPSLSRDTGADILRIVATSKQPVPIESSIQFAKDSLFCEYAYVIDLDSYRLEIYKGFNRKPLDKKERFYSDDQPDDEYWPVGLLTMFSLYNLPKPDEFVNEIQLLEDLYERQEENSDEK